MDEHKVMNLIEEIESDYPVHNWKINSIDIWPVFRIITSFNLINANNTKETSLELKEHPKEIPNLSSLLTNNEKADFLFFSDSQYKVDMDGVWYNRLSDPFYEEVVRQGYKAINLDFSFQNAGKFPTVENTFSLQNQLIHREKRSESELEIALPQFETVREKLIEETESETILTKQSLIYIVNEMLYWIDIFKEILVKKQIKFVFIVNYYQVISHSLIFICRELNIPTVDIQHGNQRDLFYHKWTNIPADGYNTLPNFFWVWTEEHAGPIRKWTLDSKQHYVIVGGNPWLEIWKKDTNRNVQKYNSKVKSIVSEQQVNILITLQPKYGLPNWETNMPEDLLQVIENSPDNYKFFVRYHQQMLHKYLDEKIACEDLFEQFIKQGKVETLYATTLPLPALLKEMDLHITPFSTCVFEAKEYNVPSITLHPRAKLFFHNEIESGWVIEADTKDEILQAIEHQLRFKENLNENNLSNNNENLFELVINKIILNAKQTDYSKSLSNKEVLFSIYYMDKEYKNIINHYNEMDSFKATLYVSYAYRELGDYENELKYMIIAIDKILGDDGIIDDPDDAYNLISRLVNEETYELYFKKIILLVNQNEKLLGTILWKLFTEQKYDGILKICGYLNKQTLDSIYYTGRVLIHKNNLKEALENITNFVCLYETTDGDNITKSKDFLISAYFYLGKIHLYLGNKKRAIYSFKKCIELTEGKHEKAAKLLEMIDQ